jgi:hypothetical protein|tara:strand:- start:476 stop:859 length:384 start_codon:yes stop_codon:yes gene_type:complete
MTRKQKYIEESQSAMEETGAQFPSGWMEDQDKLEERLKTLMECVPVMLSAREEQLYNHGWQCLKDYKNKKIDYDELLRTEIKVKRGHNARGEKLDGKTFNYMALTWPSGDSGIGGRIGLLRELELEI